MSAPSPSPVTPARRQLLELFRSVHFGRIRNLKISDGQPIFTPPPIAIRTLKLTGEAIDNQPPPAEDVTYSLSKSQVTRFFEQLDRLGTGTIERIELAHGLPLFVEIEASSLI